MKRDLCPNSSFLVMTEVMFHFEGNGTVCTITTAIIRAEPGHLQTKYSKAGKTCLTPG